MSSMNINEQAKEEGLNLIHLSEGSILCTGLTTDYGTVSNFSHEEALEILHNKDTKHYVFATDANNNIIVVCMDEIDSAIPSSTEEVIAFLKEFIIGKTIEDAIPEKRFGLIVSYNGLTSGELSLQVSLASEYRKLSGKFNKTTEQVLDLLKIMEFSNEQIIVVSELITYIKDRDIAYSSLSNKLLKMMSRKANKGGKIKPNTTSKIH